MLYGCCINMVTHRPDVSGLDVVPILKQLGYDYAELSLSHLCELTDKEFGKLADELNLIGFPIEACNNFFPPTIRLTGPEADFLIINSYLEKAFSRAIALGVKTIVFGSGMARMVPDGFQKEAAFGQLAETLCLINDYSSKYAITIAIEPLRIQECNIVNSYNEAMLLAKAVSEPAIKCLLDVYHLSQEGETLEIINEMPEMLAHVHLAEPNGRVFPMDGTKKILHRLFSNLHKIGYDSRISIEAYATNFEEEASIALSLLKEVEKESKMVI